VSVHSHSPLLRSSFISEVVTWAREETVTITLGYRRVDRKVAEHELINRIFFSWDRAMKGSLSLQDIVSGLNSIMGAGLMDAMEWFFALHVRLACGRDSVRSAPADDPLPLPRRTATATASSPRYVDGWKRPFLRAPF
jgi:hypothetical protein